MDLGLAAWLSGGKAQAEKEAWYEEAEAAAPVVVPPVPGAPDAAAGNQDVKAAWERLAALTRRDEVVPDGEVYEVVDLLGDG